MLAANLQLKEMLIMFLDVGFITDQIMALSQDLQTDPEFRRKSKRVFVEMVQNVRNGFAETFGYYQSSVWLKNILQSTAREDFTIYLSYRIVDLAMAEEESLPDSEEEFVTILEENISKILNNFYKVAIDLFLELDMFLPQWIYENNRLKWFLYGNYSVRAY